MPREPITVLSPKMETSSSRNRWIFGPKGDEVTGGWRKLHNEELRDLYSLSSTSIIRITKSRGYETDRACSTNAEEKCM
jgi:hypothetical protein